MPPQTPPGTSPATQAAPEPTAPAPSALDAADQAPGFGVPDDAAPAFDFADPGFGEHGFSGLDWGGKDWGGPEFRPRDYPEPQLAGRDLPPEPPPPPAAMPAPALAPAMAPTPGADLRRKAELEAAMLAAPADDALRAAYFNELMRLAVTRTGLLWAHLPELPAPLAFRGATPDIGVLMQLFRQPDAPPPGYRATPLRILVIGAYGGFTAIDLARRHPRATLLCAEPLADNFRLLSLNSTPWPRIRVANAAVWFASTPLAPVARHQADWSVRLGAEAADAQRTLPALSAPDLLARAGWVNANMVHCDASGAEREIFADPYAAWLTHLDVAEVRLHEHLSRGVGETVARCFPEDLFERRMLGDLAQFVRRVPRMALPPAPPERLLLSATGELMPFALSNTAQAGWAFFVFDGASCQLHPNPPGAPAARALFQAPAEGHAGFVADLHHAGNPGGPAVRFTVSAERDGRALARAEAVVAAGGRGRLTLPLPAMDAPFTIALQTEMAPGAPHNQMAWARWIAPRLAA